MSHHGPNPNHPDIQKHLADEMHRLREEMCNNAWPDGMMREDDEGVLPMAVGIENKRVMIRFAEPTAWVGMTPEQAMQLAQSLINKARQAGLTRMMSITL